MGLFGKRGDASGKFDKRCPLHKIQNASDPDKGFQLGYPLYTKAEELRKKGDISGAIVLLNEARYYGYDAPALYTAYVMAYRQLKDYESEIAMIDEFLSRNTYGKDKQFIDRRKKAVALLEEARKKG